jgi:hypothetical protein
MLPVFPAGFTVRIGHGRDPVPVCSSCRDGLNYRSDFSGGARHPQGQSQPQPGAPFSILAVCPRHTVPPVLRFGFNEGSPVPLPIVKLQPGKPLFVIVVRWLLGAVSVVIHSVAMFRSILDFLKHGEDPKATA